MIFLDLEFYVPKTQRRYTRYTLRANPCKEGQFLMGGVLVNTQLFKQVEDSNLEECWIWREPDFNEENVHSCEKRILEKIYLIFKTGWSSVKKQKDLVAIGTGIARVDLPFLYVRSMQYDFASKDELFSTFFSSKIIDLSNVGSALKPGLILHPLSNNELLDALGIEQKKRSGMRVWDQYDSNDYEAIEARTREEIYMNIKMYYRLRRRYQKES